MGVILVPYLYQHLPNEKGRFVKIIDGLNAQKSDQPDVVLLGNSSTMCLNSDLVGKKLGAEKNVWNIATPGQRPVLSYWMLTQLSTYTQVVIVGIELNHLQEKISFQGQDMHELGAIGYDVTPMKYLAGQLEIEEEWLDESPIAARMAGRSILRKSINFSVTRFLRRDLDMSQSVNSLVYPTPYREAKSKKPLSVQERSIRIRSPFTINEGQLSVLKELARWSEAHKKQLFFYLQPSHPMVKEVVGVKNHEALGKQLHSFCSDQGMGFLQVEHEFGEDQFYDLWHLNAQGAAVFAQELGSHLSSQIN